MVCKHCHEPIKEWYKEYSGRIVYLHSNGGTVECLINLPGGRFKIAETYATLDDKEDVVLRILRRVDEI